MRTSFFLEKYHCNFALMIDKFPFLDLKTATGQKCSSYQMCCFWKKKKRGKRRKRHGYNIILEMRDYTTNCASTMIKSLPTCL